MEVETERQEDRGKDKEMLVWKEDVNKGKVGRGEGWCMVYGYGYSGILRS